MGTTPSNRRRLLLRVGTAWAGGAIVGAAGLGAPRAARAAAWPERPIRIVVPYAAGQGADVLARWVGQEVAKTLGQAIVIENRAGAGGDIGAGIAARATPDGYTFLLGTNATNAANEFLYPNPGFNAATDLEAVAMIGLLPLVFCTSLPDLPTNGVEALVAKARAQPDSLAVGLPSTSAQVVLAQFARMAKAPLLAVKYKASGQALGDLIGGQIPLAIDTVTATRAHIASGRMRALGLSSPQASAMLPGVKPIAEQGVPGFDVVAWDAFFAPRGTPAAVVQAFAEHVGRVVRSPEGQARLMEIGVEPAFMAPAPFAAFVKDEQRKWGAVIKAAGIQPD